jgi:hypothetical protein
MVEHSATMSFHLERQQGVKVRHHRTQLQSMHALSQYVYLLVEMDLEEFTKPRRVVVADLRNVSGNNGHFREHFREH